jgi:hypothetical protein
MPNTDKPTKPKGKQREAIRWNMEAAAREFRVHRKTLSTRLTKEGTIAGEDGCFSTDQITKALYGDIEKQKIRIATETADRIALGNDETRRGLVNKADLMSKFQAVFAEIRQRILNSPLENDRKDSILKSLSELQSV